MEVRKQKIFFQKDEKQSKPKITRNFLSKQKQHKSITKQFAQNNLEIKKKINKTESRNQEKNWKNMFRKTITKQFQEKNGHIIEKTITNTIFKRQQNVHKL